MSEHKTVTGKKGGTRELSSIRIEKAANGFTVDCNYRYSDPKKKEMAWDQPSDRHVFKTAGEAAEFVKKELGD